MLIELKSEQEIELAYEVIKELRQNLSLAGYKEKVADCQKRGHYQLFAWEEEDEWLACCGVMPMPTLYYRDCLWIADLVVAEKARGQGIGSQCLAAIEQWAKEAGYQEVALSSGVQRKEAHRFYQEKGAYQLVSYQFKKEL